MIISKPITVDEYIAGFPEGIQEVLEQVRAAVKKAAPAAEETINYAIPTFTLHGNLVHFAAFKNHIGFYPAPAAIKTFGKELSVYKGAKGTVQFPLELITRMVTFRVKQQLEKAGLKKKQAPAAGKRTANR